MSENTLSENPVSENEEPNPFSPENLAISQFILTARLYDVGMAILTHLDSEKGNDLLELHNSGVIVGPQPSFNGVFVTDEVNDTGENEELSP